MSEISYNLTHSIWVSSSVGQSNWLLINRSWVQVPPSPQRDNINELFDIRCDNDNKFPKYAIIDCISKFSIFRLIYIQIVHLYYLGTEIWCNGSTRDFGSLCTGSNPVISTKAFRCILIISVIGYAIVTHYRNIMGNYFYFVKS